MSAIKPLANRKFYSLPENPNRVTKNKLSVPCKKREDVTKLLKYIDDNLVGRHTTFTGPFGRRKVVYCDYTTCGRSLQFIEDYISKEVLPNCGTPTGTANVVSLQSTLFRHEAKEFFKICANTKEEDLILFVGHGCDGPIRKLLQELDFQEPPIVFVGSNEPEVTLLPWQELGAKIVKISESEEGFLDLNDLENQLILHEKNKNQLIGCFSAANNISGILVDDIATTLLLHQHGALSFWNYNIAAPYIELDMNPVLPGVEEKAVYKDVIFFSMHNFIGGNQTPGILISKISLFKNSTKSCFSSPHENKDNVRHVIDVDVHDDCGAATLTETVRAGLVIHLKEAVGLPALSVKQEKIIRTLLSHVKNIPEFILLGNNSHTAKRLPFFSFLVRHPRGMFLHHNFICAVLNDVFGIQVLAESLNTDPHSQDFMGIDFKLAERYINVIQSHALKCSSHRKEKDYDGLEILRPGFIKISLPFCISDAELAFILEALKMVATEGWKLLPQYVLKPDTGEWRHQSNAIFRDRKWLSSLRYVDGRLMVPERKVSSQGTCPVDYEECLQVARCIFNKARKIAQRCPLATQNFVFEHEAELLRWFMLPREAHDLLIGNSQNVRQEVPFHPSKRKCFKDDLPDFNRKKGMQMTKVENENRESETITKKEVLDCEDLSLYNNQNYSTVKSNISDFQNISLHSVPPSCVSQGQDSSLDKASKSFCPELFVSSQPQSVSTNLPSTNVSSPVINSTSPFNYYPQPAVQAFLPNQMDFSFPENHNNNIHYHSNNGKYEFSEKTSYKNQNFDFVKRNTKNLDAQQFVGKLDPQQHMNKVHFLLGKNETFTRQRCNSLGSSLVTYPKYKGNLYCSCRSITDGETSLNLSECSLSSNEDIHAYVTEVTKELATEIKSEIREVISKVEDVLSESEPSAANHTTDSQSIKNYEIKLDKLERANSLPAASANDIAQYLMGVSKEMAEEMKSEIRELVSSVVSSEASPSCDKNEKKTVSGNHSKNKNDEDSFRFGETDKLSNNQSFHSRDSGINLSYAETVSDTNKYASVLKEKKKVNVNSIRKQNRSESLDSLHDNDETLRPRSESLDSFQENEDSDAAGTAQISKRKISRSSKKAEKYMSKNRPAEKSGSDESFTMEGWKNPRWYCPSKVVWKPAVEALKQFEMIKDGDKVLVYLSEGRNSVAILHVLQQYKFYASSRGINFEFGALIFGSNPAELHIKLLKSYLQGLGIRFLVEEKEAENWISKKGHFYTIAKDKNYNVIALEHTLDDLAEFFFISAFHNGRLRSLKAHYVSGDDIRIIRPFVYVREKALRQFVDSRNLPFLPENCLSCKTISKKSQSIKQMLSHQESIFPRFFSNLKAALQPLMRHKIMLGEGKLDKYAIDSDEMSLI